MKKKDKDQLRSLAVDELRKELAAVPEKGSKTRNVREGKALRLRRAVVLTILREKELAV